MRHIQAFVAFFAVYAVILSGCATKTNQANVDQLPVKSSASAAQESADPNPILLEEEYEAEQRGEVPSFDIPVVRNARVEQWLTYFQGRGRKWYHLWLERSGRYIPFMKKILREHRLPEDLVYLAMIESGFSTSAFSRARASGPWQFMKGTARLYGLKVGFFVDQRRDPLKSTVAAAQHLKDLYDQFQSWKLAAAAYNAGPGKVSRAIKRYKTEDFWELTKGHYLRAETRNYVPKLIAAALIAKEPAKYGFTDIQFEVPLSYDTIVVEEPVNLVVLAKKLNGDLDELMALNPELNHPVTPPDEKKYELRVPAGMAEKFIGAYQALNEDEKFHFTAHMVRKGDTFAKLAKIYQISAAEIARVNEMSVKARLHQGSTVLVPVPLGDHLVATVKKTPDNEPRRHRGVVKRTNRVSPQAQDVVTTANDSENRKVHVVQAGESLWDIAKQYGTSVVQIKHLNRLHRNQIFPGKRLIIPAT